MTERIDSPARAAEVIRAGGLVAFPTETVFGLGVDATNEQAVTRLFEAKGRPSNNPLIVHLSDPDDWGRAASRVTTQAMDFLQAFSPGPLTVVLPKLPEISPLVTANLPTVGIRIPDHAIARDILRRAEVPVAAPSANRSGRPSGTTWQAVLEDLDGRIDGIYCEDSTRIGIESTVVDCSNETPLLLRPGAITLRQLRNVVPEIRELPASSRATTRVNSPGLAHPHYQPLAEVILIHDPMAESIEEEAAYCGLTGFDGVERLAMCKVFESLEAYAAGFYEFLREADRRSIPRVFVHHAPDRGIGHALRDRQHRAAMRDK